MDRIKVPIAWDEGFRPIGGECCEDMDATLPYDEAGFGGHTPHDKWSKLLGTLLIAGEYHHIEAYQVTEANDVQVAVCPDENNYDIVAERFCEGAAQTVEINGREYVVVVTPFQD